MEVVELLDALPKPTTVECFVESLDRPLKVIGSTSTLSAQPANQGSPRLFGIFGPLLVSWVPAGPGSRVLEFSEERGAILSVKAELHMPIEDKIEYADFEHILLEGGGTACGACHLLEEPVDDIPLGPFFASEALRPGTPDTVRVQTVRDLHNHCDLDFDARRCSILAATFEHGEVVDSDFPRPLPTIYD